MIKTGDYVVRKSYNGDILFEVIEIKNKQAILKGVDVRLLADSPINDLIIKEKERNEEEKINFISNIDRSSFFYIPGKILHIDSDTDYMQRCENYYKENKCNYIAKCIKEENVYKEIKELIQEYNPDIVVITGHDAYYKNKNEYKNSNYFIKAVKEVRKIEKERDKLIVVAGACQSNYEELIKAGSTFASSPKRENIHALDPAVIAAYLSLSDKENEINIKELISKTKYKEKGVGGIKTKGTMYTGYPRGKKS